MITTSDGIVLDAQRHRGGADTVVLAHGITGDLDEQGLFPALSDRLAAAGFSVLRFSFRGHGNSAGEPRDMTIAGERLDLRAVVESAQRPVSVVASSFGAVSTTLSLSQLPIESVVLWQPVLDLHRTFLRPELPRGRELYGDLTPLRERGFLDIEGRFELGAQLFAEFAELDPRAAFLASEVPALVVHGDADEHVSYEVARETANRRLNTDWHGVRGGGHGFRGMAEEVVEVTASWLRGQAAR